MSRRLLAIVGSAVFLVIAPGFVAGFVPWWISRWRLQAPFFGMPIFRLIGGALIALGVASLLDSFMRFALQGVGTPAPVFPTRHLVVSGLYRYVRNPMYRRSRAPFSVRARFLETRRCLHMAGLSGCCFTFLCCFTKNRL
jgi:protein-S-isoprenylcysteine O-methyltransferase Ste14